MKNLIPADTIDAKGNVWKTTGENIRHGAKEFSENDIRDIVDIIFPVGSVYCGENSFVLSVGTWKQITDHVGSPVILGSSLASGGVSSQPTILKSDTEKNFYIAIRMFKRIS